MSFATLDDLLQVEPTIQDYGVLDWDVELERSSIEIVRVLKVRWYNAYQQKFPVLRQQDLDASRLDSSQLTQATVYHALAYHICPKLTKFEAETDKFQVMMQYYQSRFEHEMDLVLREGVRYDVNEDGEIDSKESEPVNKLRLVR
jgi:hypothetical protein